RRLAISARRRITRRHSRRRWACATASGRRPAGLCSHAHVAARGVSAGDAATIAVPPPSDALAARRQCLFQAFSQKMDRRTRRRMAVSVGAAALLYVGLGALVVATA